MSLSGPALDATRHTGLPHPLQDAVRHRHRRHFAGARHRRQCRDLLAVRPDFASPPPGAGARPARQSRSSRSQARFSVVWPGGRLRRGVQLPDVPGSRAEPDRFHGTRGALRLRRQSVLSRPADDGGGNVRLGVVLPDPRPAPGPGTPPYARGRPEHRYQLRRGARVRLLAVALRE
ncbi:MAG: hypothetical protein DMD50_17190 [Gemmatimonadetes bacterium]|nr:MAG: hypothetical protein DMD50_17190 [Gemmatimonadota bacterium]